MCGASSSGPTLTDKSSAGCVRCTRQDTTAPSVPAVGDVSVSFAVLGLTCGSCASRVTSAVSVPEEVSAVRVDLVPGGDSTVTVRGRRPITAGVVRSAVEQAGYQFSNA